MTPIMEIWLQFREILLGIRLNDVLDILVVSYLIYKVVELVRSTRAIQLFKGVFVILLIYIVVRLTKMEMMQMFFDSIVLQVGVFAIIVIFQQEIRRIIEQLGRSSIKDIKLLGMVESEEEQRKNARKTIRAVAEACQLLRNMKMGALMVFERKDNLSEVMRSGTIVDGTPTMELIGNIFFNKAPLHDGAMIIRDNKIHAAGCILPLTQNIHISSELGTRHRAAIGVSEASDAVVVVVSEETGNISIARNGRLTRNYTKDTLLTALEGMLLEENRTNDTQRKLFPRKKGKQHE
ncbi:MAG: diadenylate cyclase CdaA [Clostridia bacterium]|nr:diadenylate cyclase CdaA [Clostridia bacterium]